MAGLVLDRLGWAYISLDIAWTIALICGMVILYIHRELPCIRIRRLPLLLLGIIPLHLYGFVCLLAYVFRPLLPCVAMFWIMSIYLPFGIAMFQVANSQFLHVASRQKQYAHLSLLSDQTQTTLQEKEAERLSGSRWRRMLRGLEQADRIDRMMVYIGIGIGVQVLLTFLVFFGSKKFHPSYGLWDWDFQGTQPERAVACSTGWEWWLSIVWQFFWAWMYAPYTLWKSRGVHDVHNWRLQTICCCLAGLPASPLWLAGLYAPQMAPVSARFIPSAWFAVSIFLMEVVTIGFPIVEIFRSHKLRQKTHEAIATWQKRQGVASPTSSVFSDYSSRGKPSSSKSPSILEVSLGRNPSHHSQRSGIYTMAGLENALRTNPVPLLQFAALRDFSGENISFLGHIADWRRSWLRLKLSVVQHRRQQFVAAVSIYAHFVSPSYSEFPINISCKNGTCLRHLFEDAASRIFRKRSISSNNSSTPFDVPPDSDSAVDLRSEINLDALSRAHLDSVAHMAQPRPEDVLTEFAIPEAFQECVFDAAEKEIKYLVLTNTWPKFVNAASESREQDVENSAQHHSWFRRSILCSS